MPVVKNERKKLFCMSCGKNVDSGSFYIGKNPKYNYWGNIPICKDCILEMYNQFYQENPDHRIAVIKFCIAMDIPFADNIFNMAMNRFAKEKISSSGWLHVIHKFCRWKKQREEVSGQ